MIWLSETFLDSSYADDDTQLNLKDFTLTGADNPRNSKIGGVSINFKKHLAVLPISLLSLNECLVLKSNIQNKKGYVTSLCQSPSQSKNEFHQLTLNFEQLISNRMSQNSLYILVTCDFK